MTVSSAIASVTFNWTGAETQFSPGFQAESTGDISITWVNAAGASGTLTLNTHFSAALDGYNMVTIGVIAFPPAPATVTIARNSTPLQIDHFQDGVPWSASIIEAALDLLTLRDQEQRRDIAALQTSVSTLTAALAAETARAIAAEQALASSVSALGTPAISAMLGVNLSTLATALPASAGTYWNNGGVLCVTPGGTNPLPTVQPAPIAGQPQLWNNGGVVCIV